MKQSYIFLIFVLLLSFGCKKDETAPPVTVNLSFESLSATDTIMAVNEITTLTAQATGEGLSYTWTAEYGTFIGSGNTVQWTVCHADRFLIKCEVKDQANNSSMKEIYIRTHEPR